MVDKIPSFGLQLRTTITQNGQLELTLVQIPIQPPREGELLVRVEASPLNPSDLLLLFGPADISTLKAEGNKVTATIPQGRMPAVAARIGQSIAAGNEGAGTVIAAGADEASQALLGRKVAIMGGAMYATHRAVATADALPLPAGVTASEGASSFVNPLTALGMVATMKLERHSALVLTAAASNLGQMLNKICLNDGIGLVNIVRSADQVQILKNLGAAHVLDSTSVEFLPDLVRTLSATVATLAFDAIGGGKLAGDILWAMEQALSSKPGAARSRLPSTVHKQVYIYGTLAGEPTELARNYGMSWGVGGWLLSTFLNRVGPAESDRLRRRVIDELKTTFVSRYAAEISLKEALRPDVIEAYLRRGTGGKYLICPANL